MAGNTFGTIFKLTSFGESHGIGIGGIIDGCPAGFPLDMDGIQNELSRRRPGQSSVSTDRKEKDEFEILSGVFEGKTTGTPLAFIIKNKDHRSVDYSAIKDVYRPSHADYVYDQKYGIRDYRGGGRSSARETVARVFAGAIAKQFLRAIDVEVNAWVHRVYDLEMSESPDEVDLNKIEDNIMRCPDQKLADKMIDLVHDKKKEGDSVGGAVKCLVKNLPAGLGEPVFDKMNSELAKAVFSINAVKYFEIGSGKNGTYKTGSDQNDAFRMEDGNVTTSSNNSGGIQGGITNGSNLVLEAGFKPVATIKKDQKTVNSSSENIEMNVDGRHDPCVVPRAVPIVESMVSIVIFDMYLRNKSIRWDN